MDSNQGCGRRRERRTSFTLCGAAIIGSFPRQMPSNRSFQKSQTAYSAAGSTPKRLTSATTSRGESS